MNHTSSNAVALSAITVAAAVGLGALAVRRTSNRFALATSLAVSAAACAAQTYGFFVYVSPG